ncbi:MAG TPA: carboxypeptidase regulatory-like domain-containing protein [Vicinamibacterales bacterium]|nr:carboxypeptidase regulatory-like domain-containing protein [Vicinamibacterales bacterium]
MTRKFVGTLLFLLLAVPAMAQQGTTELRGRVLDSQGGVLPGVTVVVRNQATGMFRETVSGTDGAFIASGLTPGTYEVTGELAGFKKLSRRDLQLEVGKTVTIDLTMEVGGIEQTVTVSAESPLVDVTSKEIGGNITSETLSQLPSVNGNFIGFIGLLPGIVPSISTESFGSDSVSVNGQDPRNNNYSVDGGNNNDDVIGQRAGMQARTPIEAIQEFQVITNQFDAEFGRTSGAIVNAVTKAGTNNVHGSAFGFFQDSSLTEKDYFTRKDANRRKADTSYQRWGGTVGGPLVQDKMHYFFSLERFAIDRANIINITTRPDLNDTQSTRDRVWNTIVRGDHQINRNNTYSVRWLRESSPQANQIIGSVTPAAARSEADVDQTLATNFNSVLSNTKVNTLRLTWTRENVTFGNACYNANDRDLSKCPVTLAFQSFTDQQDNTGQYRINDAIQLDETVGWFLPGKRGDHDIKFGAQYQYSGAYNRNDGNLNGTFTFGRSDVPFNPSDPRSYPDRFSIRVGGPSIFYEKAHYVSAFAQDKWRLNSRATLSLGLRYDLEIIPIPETDDPLVSSYPIDKNNIQPRVGLTYDLGGGTSVVRGGYGRFYDKTHFELIGGLFTGTPFTSSFTFTTPVGAADPNPRLGLLPIDPFLTQGPVINTALLNQRFPAGSLLRNTGASWDNADRQVPYTDQVTAGYERQIAGNMAISADYVHAFNRDMLMSKDLNAGLRNSTSVTDAVQRIYPQPALVAAYEVLRQRYPGFANFTTGVTQPLNIGQVDYDALLLSLNKRFSRNYSARVSYTLAYSRGNTSGSGVPTSGFQVLDDMNLDLNEGPTAFDTRHNFVVSGQALVPRTGGLNVSWVVRALSGSPFSLTNNNLDPDRNGSSSEPLPAGDYTGTATGVDVYTVKHYKSERNGAKGPGFMNADVRLGYRIGLPQDRRVEIFADIFNVTNRTNFANPSGNSGNAATFLVLNSYSTSYAPRKLQLGVRFQF